MEIPARIHVLLAQNAPQAVIIRRGPSKQTAIIGWDRNHDTFTIGQWFKGKIYHYRSDISSDGRHWIYFAMDAHSKTWTAIARTPYLKALDFYPKGDAWNGGGLFATNHSYWLNECGPTKHLCNRYTSGLTVLQQWNDDSNMQGECPSVYFFRLERDGWKMADTLHLGKYEQIIKFIKPIHSSWYLCKLFHAGLHHPIGKGTYYENHMLFHAKSGEQIDFPDMEWADVDGNRLLWSEQGKIMSSHISRNGLEKHVELVNLNSLQFTERKAPY